MDAQPPSHALNTTWLLPSQWFGEGVSITLCPCASTFTRTATAGHVSAPCQLQEATTSSQGGGWHLPLHGAKPLRRHAPRVCLRPFLLRCRGRIARWLRGGRRSALGSAPLPLRVLHLTVCRLRWAVPSHHNHRRRCRRRLRAALHLLLRQPQRQPRDEDSVICPLHALGQVAEKHANSSNGYGSLVGVEGQRASSSAASAGAATTSKRRSSTEAAATAEGVAPGCSSTVTATWSVSTRTAGSSACAASCREAPRPAGQRSLEPRVGFVWHGAAENGPCTTDDAHTTAA
jgi:hypothetical protein